MDLEAAAEMIRKDIKWRQEEKPETITDEDVIQVILFLPLLSCAVFSFLWPSLLLSLSLSLCMSSACPLLSSPLPSSPLLFCPRRRTGLVPCSLQVLRQGTSRFLGFTSDGAIVIWNQAKLWRPEELVGLFLFFSFLSNPSSPLPTTTTTTTTTTDGQRSRPSTSTSNLRCGWLTRPRECC